MLYHPVKKKIVRRIAPPGAPQSGQLPPLLQRIFAARGLLEADPLNRSLAQVPSPWLLSGMETMVEQLEATIAAQRSLMVIADYDADGATACAVAVRGLRALGLERVDFLVPDRFRYGYGLTPEIVALAAERKPDVLLTVDNGISSLDGVVAANGLGIEVLITDHHLPGMVLPDASAIVNPNLLGDPFPCKSLAGVGVMFYVLSALRQRLREKGRFEKGSKPNLAQLLDLVALGTVADVVNLDPINRVLVHQGLQRIRAGQAQPGVLALLQIAGRKHDQATASDLGFCAGPRLNAAGRLEDMRLGIECLLSDDPEQARGMAADLDRLNRERRDIEDQMKQDALVLLDSLDESAGDKAALCLFDEAWHQGVIGILASRIKDRVHRPVIAFAPGVEDGEVKGSARSIPGVHIRDVLCDVAAAHPELIRKFGGHAMAAGLSLHRENLDEFAAAFEAEVARHLDGMDLEHAVQTDGGLAAHEFTLDMAELLRSGGPWGQGCPEPMFDGTFQVAESRVVGEKHLKLTLRTLDGQTLSAISFFVEDPWRWLDCRQIHAAYRLDVNEYKKIRSVQLRIEYMESEQ